jgi:type II secretory pathway pseudopilin PulG
MTKCERVRGRKSERGLARRRGAFTLIESVVIVVVLAISLPATLTWLDQANMRRVDAVNSTRATAMATSVMEHVLADVASKNASLGFGALANSATYLNTPVTGLTARLSTFASLYTSMGFSYAVNIGALVDKTGTTTGNGAQDIFRVITVTVSFTGADGTGRTLSIQSMVTSL